MAEKSSGKTLSSLLRGVTYRCRGRKAFLPLDEICLTDITCDSRKAGEGTMFVALRGVHFDGHSFIEVAVKSGSNVVLCEEDSIQSETFDDLDCLFVCVPDSASAYAEIAANFFGRASKRMRYIGITGTNGKTTVTYLLEQVLKKAGKSVGVIGTVNNRYTTIAGITTILPTAFTTPEAFILQRVLWEMAEAEIEYVVMEVSSHALKQARVGTLEFEVAAFTNISRDHLDYHLDMDDYFDSKSILFSNYLSESGTAVLPAHDVEDASGLWLSKLHEIAGKRTKKIIGWGTSTDSDLQLLDYHQDLTGSIVTIRSSGEVVELTSPLVGRFNVENLMTVAGIAVALGLTVVEIREGLSGAAGAPGRLERVVTGSNWNVDGPVVLVDYAHTPDALEKVLKTLSELPHKDLFCVFGCGGDRDRGKRPQMAKIAGQYADVAIVTDDNPRTEDPDRIVSEILAGFDKQSTPLFAPEWIRNRLSGMRGGVVTRKRDVAIHSAVKAAGAKDIVLVAGKGHEPYQITAEGRRYFDDCREAAVALFSWTEALVGAATGGIPDQTLDLSRPLGEITTDSRVSVEKGIFIALAGDNHDAHDYAAQAVENGCRCLVVNHKIIGLDKTPGVKQIIVGDTLKALGDLAAFRRQAIVARYGQKIIGITGSCGKTTVKEMVAAILARKWPAGEFNPPGCVLKTQGNFNNLIGLPLSLLPFGPLHRAAILEMGMNQPGEISRLAEIAAPDISCILNVHGAHLEGLSTIEGVARAKEEIFQGTKSEGTLVINLDDQLISRMSTRYSQNKISFSMIEPSRHHKPDVWPSDVVQTQEGGLVFTLHCLGNTAEVRLYTAGFHNIANGLAAAALTYSAGADLDTIASGLADFRPPDKRLQIFGGSGGVLIVNDTYNANPASMAAGLKTLAQLNRRVKTAIIGDMLELGNMAEQSHYETGRVAAELHLDRLVTVGDYSANVAEGAVAGGMEPEKIFRFVTKDDCTKWLRQQLDEKKFGQDDAFLVKASRGRRFETIVEILAG